MIVLLGYKGEYHSDTCCKVFEPLKHHAKWNKQITRPYTVEFHFYVIPRRAKGIATESSHSYEGLGTGNGERVFNGGRLSG